MKDHDHRPRSAACRTVAFLRLWACLAAGLISGCRSTSPPAPPPPPPVSTAPQRTLDDFAQDVASELAGELPIRPAVQSRRARVLGLGPIEVRGFRNRVPFEACVASVRSRLVSSAAITNAFRVVSVTTADANAIVRDIAGDTANEDYLLPDGSNVRDVETLTYPPDAVFVLTGEFISLGGGDDRRQSFNFTINVVHARTREQIYSRVLRRDVVWNDKEGRWNVRD